jgi:DNA-binding MarR family transcriptional regulator
MSRATSNFLQGANAANAAFQSAASEGAEQTTDDAAILAAVETPEVHDVNSLAVSLGVTAAIAQPIVQKLAKRGLVELVGASLKLSRAGERALRYTSMAK